ncbi:MAG: hypothetical protein AAFV53_40580 [Myxococcota bacterium]
MTTWLFTLFLLAAPGSEAHADEWITNHGAIVIAEQQASRRMTRRVIPRGFIGMGLSPVWGNQIFMQNQSAQWGRVPGAMIGNTMSPVMLQGQYDAMPIPNDRAGGLAP